MSFNLFNMPKGKKRIIKDGDIISYYDLCGMPNHYKVYDFPKEVYELGFKPFEYMNEHVAIVSSLDNGMFQVKTCYGIDFYGEIRYPIDIKTDNIVELNQQQLNEFLHLISKERLDDKKNQEKMEYEKNVKDFAKKWRLSDRLWRSEQLRIWTESYFQELLGERTRYLKFKELTNDAYWNFVYHLYDLYKFHIVNNEKQCHRLLEKQINSENTSRNDDDGSAEFDDDDDDFSYEIRKPYEMFYELYPMFKEFSHMIYDMAKGEVPNGDCVCGSDCYNLNSKYHQMVFEWLCQLIFNGEKTNNEPDDKNEPEGLTKT